MSFLKAASGLKSENPDKTRARVLHDLVAVMRDDESTPSPRVLFADQRGVHEVRKLASRRCGCFGLIVAYMAPQSRKDMGTILRLRIALASADA